MGTGLRSRRDPRGEDARGGGRGGGAPPRHGRRSSSTPASGGSPARRSTAVARSRRATSAAYREIAARYATPPMMVFAIGLGMVAPTILAHAIPEVRERYLRAPLPRRPRRVPAVLGAGRGLRPRGDPDARRCATATSGSSRGQKVWTSGAHLSDIGEIITRTSPDKPKHKGLTMFVVDMKAPGVDIRPLRQMTGGASFNEVFFDEVRVPDTHRLGDVDEGWTVALTTLMNERAAIGAGGSGFGSIGFARFVADGPPLRRGRRSGRAPAARRRVRAPPGRTDHEPARDGPHQGGPAPRAGDVDREARR